MWFFRVRLALRTQFVSFPVGGSTPPPRDRVTTLRKAPCVRYTELGVITSAQMPGVSPQRSIGLPLNSEDGLDTTSRGATRIRGSPPRCYQFTSLSRE